jgi:hypothetical protein
VFSEIRLRELIVCEGKISIHFVVLRLCRMDSS